MTHLTFRDALRSFALSALARELRHASTSGRLRFVPNDGTELWPEEVDSARRALGPAAHDSELADDTPLEQTLWHTHERLLGEGDRVAQRWFDVSHRLGLSLPERTALALLVGLSADMECARLARYAWADQRYDSPPRGFLLRLLQASATSAPNDHERVAASPFCSGSLLARSGLIAVVDGGALPPLHTVHMHREVADYLLGQAVQDTALLGFNVGDPPTRLRNELARQLRRISSALPFAAAIIGPVASGRLGVAAQIARAVAPDTGLYQLSIGTSVRQDTLGVDLARAKRVTILTGALLAITGLEELDDARTAVEATRRALSSLPIACVWVSPNELPKTAKVPGKHVVRIGYPSRAERVAAWSQALGVTSEDPALTALAARLAGGFLLSEGQIRRAVEDAEARREAPHGWNEEHLIEAARAHAETGLGALATPEECSFGLDHMVLDERTERELQALLTYARDRGRLLTEWGLDEVIKKSTGVTALFVGPPGTGKTLAATVLAHELGLELYRVDVSQLVSKYIGETEKHLGALFTAAEQGEVMLLFDEADSLFAKRTDVKSSVDRYANMETNFLLQRIESFKGFALLTTNHEAGIDQAFARRIRFRVLFDAPDADARRRLWRLLLPSKMPLAEDVNVDLLAETYELSGGHIKEVILRAASTAYAIPGCVAHTHLENSAEDEYRKLGLLSPRAGRRREGERR